MSLLVVDDNGGSLLCDCHLQGCATQGLRDFLWTSCLFGLHNVCPPYLSRPVHL
jgi:hypothetical protein